MELRQFRYFVAVAEELHFTRAAERLHIGQPPLSLQIQSIERELGVMLLKRTRRKVELTPAGELFLHEARLALSQAARAIDTAKRAAKGEMGTLRLNFITSVPLVDVFTRAVRSFRQLVPDVHLELKIRPSHKIIEDVVVNAIDLGFTRPAANFVLPTTVKSLVVHTDRLMLVLPSDHPLTQVEGPIPVERLRHEKFVLRPSGTGAGFYEQVFSLCAEAGFAPNIVQEATEATTTLGLVAAGVGITVAPQALQAIAIKDVVWRDLAGPGTESKVLLVYNKAAVNSLRDLFISGLRTTDPEDGQRVE